MTDQPVGEVHRALTLPNGTSIDSVDWQVLSSSNSVVEMGTLNTTGARSPSFISSVPTGMGYTVSMTATTSTNTTCVGSSSPFSVAAGQATMVNVNILCSAMVADGGTLGSVVVTGMVVAGDHCPGAHGLVHHAAVDDRHEPHRRFGDGQRRRRRRHPDFRLDDHVGLVRELDRRHDSVHLRRHRFSDPLGRDHRQPHAHAMHDDGDVSGRDLHVASAKVSSRPAGMETIIGGTWNGASFALPSSQRAGLFHRVAWRRMGAVRVLQSKAW